MDRSAMILLQITLCLTVLVVETYSSISWTREILHRIKRQAECKPDEFKCTSGECIDIVSMCDGTKKCADGSDETEIICKQLNITDYPSPREGGCLLPQPPEFGAYTSPVCHFDKKTAACKQVPGTPVPHNWMLSFKCNEGYYLNESQDNIMVFCINGKWSPTIPVCRTCGRRNWKGVNTPQITHGSAAKYGEFPWYVGLYQKNATSQWILKCGGSLISPHIVLTAAYCVYMWERNIKYIKLPPEAIKVGLGKYYREWTHEEPYAVQADVREILVPPGYNGTVTTVWKQDVALLVLTRSVQLNAGIMPVCVDWKREFTIPPGALGTLAGWGRTEHGTPSDVLLLVDLTYVDHSHCINQIPKLYQPWVTSDKFCGGYTNGTGARPGDFGGGLTFVQDDLYYVYGITSSTYTLLPDGNNSITAFINITNEDIFTWLISSKNKFDKEHDEEYPENSPSPPEGGCLLPQPPEFGAYTSPVCQIGKKTAACRQVPGTPVPKNWVLSFKCNEGYYLKESQDNIMVFCINGKWSPKIPVCRTCGRRNWKGVNTPQITHGSAAKYGEFPWYVGLYQKNATSQWVLKCGGSLISPHIVLTAAYCVYTWERNIKYIKLPPEAIKVGLGKYYREWTHEEPYAVQADVREILVPPGYNGTVTTVWRQDVALLVLTRSVQLNAVIMPVCVDWKREFTIPPGALGTLAGWGRTEHGTPSDVLLLVDLTYVDHSHCINQIPKLYQPWVTSDKFCGGYTNGTGARPGDFGGGLTFVQDDLYYVYGITSSTYTLLPESNNSITAFINITNEDIFTWLISSKNKFDKEHDEEYPENSPFPPEGGCLLPQPPEFGAYTSPVCQFDKKTAACRHVPGTPVPHNWVLSFKCNEGYYLKEFQDNIMVFCINGKWSPKIPVCRTCGRRNWKGVNTPQITHGSAAKYGEFPWYVGLYQKNATSQWDLKCGGSLISPHIVLTAAYCVFTWEGSVKYIKLPPEAIKVGLGKYYREWTHEEPYAVQADVREILVPPGYSGWATGYIDETMTTVWKQDIALLVLTRSVQLNAVFMPVCVDWKREFTIPPGALGTLAGWGYTEHHTSSDVLLLADLTYVDHSHCINQVPELFQHWVTSDKFCGVYTNDTADRAGDHGGGLTFVQDDLYYVYGITSSTYPLLPDGNNSITTFINITNEEIFTWLISSKNKFDKDHDEEYPEKCPPTSFQCANGTCIDGSKRCNKEVDCSDGSDEAAPECSGATSTTTEVPVPVPVPLKCKETEFKCTSGQCIDKSSVCDSRVDCPDKSDETESQCSSVSPSQTGGCLVPQSPEFGSSTAAACEFESNNSAACIWVPGTPVPEHWALSVKCSDGYYIKETQDENFHTFCVNGKWSPTIPVCRKMCSPLVSLSVAIRCFNKDDDTDCSMPVRPGTRAKAECKQSYTPIQTHRYIELLCRDDGQWNYDLFYCQPVCGKRNTQSVNKPLITYGSSTKYAEFPWHVGLYMRNKSSQWEQACGGTLISPHIVLTAAHCVFSELVKALSPPEAIKVGLGKYHREWTHDEPYAVQANVSKILIPPWYYGSATSYIHDIALLDLTHSVQIHANIMPVCVDWNRELTVTPGTLGTLAGWGVTEHKTTSDVLLHVDLPYIDYYTCLKDVQLVFQRYVTPDKFCAGYRNGTGAAQGDSGGGLTFVHDDLYYVHGIVSTKVREANSFITFTNISNEEIFSWFNRAKRTLDEAHNIET